MNLDRLVIAVSLATLVSACETSRLEREFGNSVRQTMEAQVYDPQAASNPDPNAPEEMDGQYGQSVLSVYRDTVGDPAGVLPPQDRVVEIDNRGQ